MPMVSSFVNGLPAKLDLYESYIYLDEHDDGKIDGGTRARKEDHDAREATDEAVKDTEQGRSVVRPSGTELRKGVSNIVFDIAGKGDRSASFV
ncbi:hypothetical protein JCM8097_001891 [Rhodosporidiobolus ruineniae]